VISGHCEVRGGGGIATAEIMQIFLRKEKGEEG